MFCSVERWENHIVNRASGVAHPEMLGRERDVEKALTDPDQIIPTTRRAGPSKDELGYDLQTASDTIRVWVRYDDPTQRFAGTTEGYISTSYVDNPLINSQIGMPIYVKGSTSTASPKKGGTS